MTRNVPDSSVIESIKCPACSKVSRLFQVDQAKDKPIKDKFKVTVCTGCFEVLLCRNMDSKDFKIMTAREFIHYLDYDAAMKIAQIVQLNIAKKTELK